LKSDGKCATREEARSTKLLPQRGSPRRRQPEAPELSLAHDPKFWRDMAEEAQRLADEMRDPESRRIMAGLAADYERLARYAEVVENAALTLRRLH
jgi:hypothetical protein